MSDVRLRIDATIDHENQLKCELDNYDAVNSHEIIHLLGLVLAQIACGVVKSGQIPGDDMPDFIRWLGNEVIADARPRALHLLGTIDIREPR